MLSLSLKDRMLGGAWLLLIFISALGLGGCASDQTPSATKTSKYGGTLYVGVETPYYGLDILGGGAGGVLLPDMVMLNSLIQEPLFRMDRDGRLIPVLALSAVNSDDGLSWEIRLREEVRFHDGSPFNADAVVHHWARMLDPQGKFRGRQLLQPILAVEKMSDYAVRFRLAHPWLPFLMVISDEQYLSSFIPSPSAVDADTHDQKPVGTGPFKHHAWNRQDHYVAMKNSDYWQPGKPYLDKIVFRTVPDHQARYASLMAGELDVVVLDRGHLLKKAKTDVSLYTHQSENNGAEIVLVNTRKPPLDDVRVRRAVALANNQELHVKMVYGNSIPTIHHPFGEWFPCPANRFPDHDLEAARQLIADYGKPVEMECLHSNTSRGRQTGELLQQLYKQIGISLKPVGLSTGPVIMKVMKRDYQLSTWRILGANDLGAQLYRTLHSQSAANFSGYSNPEMDDLLEAQRAETDPVRRDELLCKIAALINRDIPFFYRGGRRYHLLARKKIQDLTEVAGVKVNLSTAWIDEKVNFNPKAFAIEKAAAVPAIDCPDPGDTAAVKAMVLGTWEGKDNWGASLTISFHENDTVTGRRTGSDERTSRYVICGQRVFIRGGASVEVTVKGDVLAGKWEKAGYEGLFELRKVPAS